MKRVIILLLFIVTAACNGPRIIPDSKLVAITHEIFLANAYRGSTLSNLLMGDTIDFYTPIFDKYGYTPTDFTYTINSLSRRKSIRFTDILEEVTRQLTREDSIMMARITLLDTVDRRIEERYKQIILQDTAPRRLTQLSNPEKPEIKIPLQPGRYLIEFISDLDTASQNTNLRYAHHQVDRHKNDLNYYYSGYLKGQRKREKAEINITDPHVRELRINFASSTSTKEKKIKLTIDSLIITYYLPLKEARDSTVREFRNFHPFIPDIEPLKNRQNDSIWKEVIGTPHPDTTGTVAKRDTLIRR